MNESLKATFEQVRKSFRLDAGLGKRSASIERLTADVESVVDSFCTEHHLAIQDGRAMRPNTAASLEGLFDAGADAGDHSLAQLVEEARIPEGLKASACDQLALIAFKYLNNNTGGDETIGAHLADVELGDSGLAKFSSVFSEAAAGVLEGDMESFGVNIDGAIPDIKLAMTVALMRFHLGCMPRALPTNVTPTTTVMFKVPRVTVYDLSDTSAADTPMIDLYGDASTVANDLPLITPLDTNDEDDSLVADNVIVFNKDVNILTLSIDSETPGFDAVNRTDTVADGARVASVRVTVTTTEPDPDVAEAFDLAIPIDMSRLTRLADSEDSADRICRISKEYFLTVDAAEADGTVSTILADGTCMDEEEGLKITLNVDIHLNLKTGVVRGMGSAEVAAHQVNGEDLTDEFIAMVGDDGDALSVVLTGFQLTARHSEENLRRSSIAIREQTRTMTYPIPIGRNYIADRALGQAASESLAAALTQIVALGQDQTGLSLVEDTLDSVATRITEATAQGLSVTAVGHNYAAGYQIRPTVVTGTLDISGLNTRADNERSADIKQRVVSYLVGVTTRLQSGSYMREQLAAGESVVYRCITSIKMLGCLLGQEHTHDHLNKGTAVTDPSGVEYRLVLPNGVVIEVVTTNFAANEDKLILVPVLSAEPTSVLNFGAVYDNGTVVGHLRQATQGARNRMFANARSQFIPTNPVGAVIDVSNAYAVNEDDLSGA